MKYSLEKVFSVVVFVVVFFIYLLTVSHSIYFTDSGELAAVSSTLGIAHPTGYPLYTILSHIWLQIPLPLSNIEKLNILSSIFLSFSAVVFYFILIVVAQYNSTKIVKSKIMLNLTAVFFAIAFAFTSIVWEQATTNEVYSLHFLLVNIFIYVLLNAYYKQSYKLFLLASFILGLSFANHLTTILLLPAAIFAFFKKIDRGFDFSLNRFKQFIFLLIPFFVALSLYLYLPLRASQQPLFNWGYVSRSFDKFIYHVSGKQYQVWMFSGQDAWEKNFNIFVDLFIGNIGLLLLVPFAISIFHISTQKDKINWIFITIFAPLTLFFQAFKGKSSFLFSLLLITFLSCVAYSFNYSIYDIDPYFYLAYFSIFLFLALSVLNYIQEMPKYMLVLALIVPFFFIYNNYNEVDKSKDEIVLEYTRSIVDNLPQNAIIISAQWDYFCSAFWYLQQVEGYRRDVVLIEKELMRRTWYPYQLERWYPEIVSLKSPELKSFMRDLELFESGKEYDPISIQANYINFFVSIIENNIKYRDIFITPEVLYSEPHLTRNYFKIPYGFAIKLSNIDENIDLNKIQINFEKLNNLSKNKKYYLYEGLRLVIANNLLAMIKYAEHNGKDFEKEKLLNYYQLFQKDNAK